MCVHVCVFVYVWRADMCAVVVGVIRVEDIVTAKVDGAIPANLADDLNASFVLSSAYLVFFMHCGFAMVSLLRSPYPCYLPLSSAFQLN